MQSAEIRRRFLNFFKERGHTIIQSAPLVPENDPTVLFTTAGMHPLVPYLIGQPHPSGGLRLADVQKCVRTNDIDEVGDNRHLTFFEMLGNWSLGDYFKDESIPWSWEFLTDKDKGLGLDPARIYVTVFAGDPDAPRDERSIELWQKAFTDSGISSGVDLPIAEGGRIFPLPKDGNWWGPAGITGPCGPDTEIFYDLGEGNGALTLANGRADFESGRLVEIWNNVFMEYFKDEHGHFAFLSQKNVDTGMGLERVATIMQGVSTVFDTDIFTSIIATLPPADLQGTRIMADHLRASVMLIADGVRPSNKDRGYVLRRLLRRAILKSGQEGGEWLVPVVAAVIEGFAEVYPELPPQQTEILQVMQEEALKFGKTIAQGKREIEKRETLSGKDAFDLYQSYGFPLELTREYAKERGVQIDEAEFEHEFELHRDLSRTAAAGQFKSGLADHSEATVRYHTATHLLHQALRELLGEHVQQKGSNITAERLRFDFSHPEKMTEPQIKAVEEWVNAVIVRDLPVTVATMSPEQARDSGALGFFAHKYGDSVTVYTIGDVSKEICTGPHVENTGTIGKFKIVKEEAVSAGVRRIKAVLE